MQAGRLRHSVTIQQRTATVDGYGQQSTAWTDVITALAAIEPLSGRELFAAQAVQSEVSHRVTIRYRSELDVPRTGAALRVAFGSRVFDVHAVLNMGERDREMHILCSEGLTNG